MRPSDAFEHSLKRTLDQYEVPYNSADWARLERALDQQRGPAWHASAGLYALLLGGSLAVATTLHLLFQMPEDPRAGEGSGMVTQVVAKDDQTGERSFVVTPPDKPTSAKSATGAKDVDPASSAQPHGPTASKTGLQRAANRIAPQARGNTSGPAPETPMPASAEKAIRVSTTEGCPGTTVDFGLENASEGGIYLWNFGDGSFSNKPRPSHTFTKSGAYEVMLSHSAIGGGSIMNRPVSDRIVIHEAPEAAFTPLKRAFPNSVPSVHFENRSVGGKAYHWEFGDGQTSSAVHPDHVFKKKGTYHVQLTVTNAKGCIDRTEHVVEVEADYDLLAPKTFSPNGDGVDDTFVPEALKTLGAKFNLTIFDATTGTVLYETSDAQRPWNGRVQNRGDACLAGDYVWVVEMKEGEKNGGTYDGTVRLLR